MEKTTIQEKNPYMKGAMRLADVIAAIQFLGTYKFYKVGFDYWEKRIKSPPRTASNWKNIFIEHPEFFRVSSVKDQKSGKIKDVVCLIMRRARPHDYNVDSGERITKQEKDKLTESEKQRISREPLNSNDVAALIGTAIELHNRTMEQQKESRWFLPLILSSMSIGGVIIGAVLGAVLKGC